MDDASVLTRNCAAFCIGREGAAALDTGEGTIGGAATVPSGAAGVVAGGQLVGESIRGKIPTESGMAEEQGVQSAEEVFWIVACVCTAEAGGQLSAELLSGKIPGEQLCCAAEELDSAPEEPFVQHEPVSGKRLEAFWQEWEADRGHP